MPEPAKENQPEPPESPAYRDVRSACSVRLSDLLMPRIKDKPEVSQQVIETRFNQQLNAILRPMAPAFENKAALVPDKNTVEEVKAALDIFSLAVRQAILRHPAMAQDEAWLETWSEALENLIILTNDLRNKSVRFEADMLKEALRNGNIEEIFSSENSESKIADLASHLALLGGVSPSTTYVCLRQDLKIALDDCADHAGVSFNASGGWHFICDNELTKEISNSEVESLANQGAFKVRFSAILTPEEIKAEEYAVPAGLENKTFFIFPVQHGDIYLGSLCQIALKPGVELNGVAKKNLMLISEGLGRALARLHRIKQISPEFGDI